MELPQESFVIEAKQNGKLDIRAILPLCGEGVRDDDVKTKRIPEVLRAGARNVTVQQGQQLHVYSVDGFEPLYVGLDETDFRVLRKLKGIVAHGEPLSASDMAKVLRGFSQ